MIIENKRESGTERNGREQYVCFFRNPEITTKEHQMSTGLPFNHCSGSSLVLLEPTNK